MLSIFLYRAALFLYSTMLRVAAPFHPKAAAFVEGRKNWLVRNRQAFTGNDSCIWFHCASLGEFEQARPLIESLHAKNPSERIVVTFFSPSGYEVRKNYELAHHVCYLPVDSPAHARIVLDLFRPRMVIFVKYEFWYHYITEAAARNIPIYAISAVFRPEQHFFKWYGGEFLRLLGRFTRIFTQTEASAQLLKQHGITTAVTAGDTRYDRVADHASRVRELPVIREFAGDRPVLVAGSSYAEEERMLASFVQRHPGRVRLIVAPHHIGDTRISEIENTFSFLNSCRYSAPSPNAEVMIIDNIGLLSSIYQYARIAFIGGGFGTSGLHNTLEAVAYGMPVLFGPNTSKFPEAGALKQAGIGFTIRSQDDFDKTVLRFLDDHTLITRTAETARAFVNTHAGATQRILEHIGG